MSSSFAETDGKEGLRRRALQRLTGDNGLHHARLNASAAFRVLYDLASSPSTGPAALALLHELQVHQVELDLQDEELRRSRVDLEATLTRQLQLYDFAPVGCFTIDESTVLRELNLTAASMLGADRESLLGRSLDSFLVAQSAHVLHAMLSRVGDGGPPAAGALQLAAGRGAPRTMMASANRDPDGRHFLVAFMDDGSEQAAHLIPDRG